MLRLVLYRVPQMLVVVLAVTLLAFILVNVLPGNVVISILGDDYSKEAAAVLTKQLGLNRPLIVRYFDWLGNAVQLNFGNSLTTHVPVWQEIGAAAWPTVELVIGGQFFGTLFGVVFAIAAVATRIGWIDRVGTALSLFFTSVPAFVLALVLLSIFGVHYHLIPTTGWVAPSNGWGANLRAIFVPCLLLGLSIFPGHMRVFRAELYEQLEGEEYVTLARMKGLTTQRVVLRHVARNSAFGLITLMAVQMGALVAGAVILEQIFGIPGIGELILNAISSHDATTVLGCVTVVAVAIVIFNLIADVLYAVLDPRVRDAQN